MSRFGGKATRNDAGRDVVFRFFPDNYSRPRRWQAFADVRAPSLGLLRPPGVEGLPSELLLNPSCGEEAGGAEREQRHRDERDEGGQERGGMAVDAVAQPDE